MNLKSRNKVSSQFNMSSMTDVVFLLLIFFMITSTMVHPNALKLLLPQSNGQVNSEKPIITVNIQDNGDNTYNYAIGTKILPFDKIKDQLKIEIGDEPEPTIALHVDKSVPMEEVVKIMNIAKENKYRLILATSAK